MNLEYSLINNSLSNIILRLKMQNILIYALNCLMLLQAFGIADNLPNQSGARCNSFCNSSTCIEQAEFFTKYMDPTVDPCDDFFQFVCGNYMKNVPIPEDQPGISLFDRIQDRIRDQLTHEVNTPIKPSDLKAFKNVKTHFQNCLNESGIEINGVSPLLELIGKLGGWPVLLEDNWKEEEYKWENTVSEISNQGFNPDFPTELSITYDSINTSNYILQVSSAATTVDESYFSPDSDSLKAYETLLIETAIVLGATREKATSEMKECSDFEVKLHKIKMTPPELTALSPVENRKSVKELSNLHSDMPWLDIFNRILNPSGVSITDDELLGVTDPQYISKIGELIEKTPKRVLANYQIWRVIFKLIDYLPRSLRNLKFNFQQATAGLEKEPERKKSCLDLLQETFPTAIGSIYVRNYFDKKSKDAANEILQNIKEELGPTLNKIEWMDEETRNNALEKLQAMKSGVGYPDQLLDDKEIENYYKELEIDFGNYFEDYCKVAKHSKDLFFSVLRKPVNETDWTFETDVAMANAFYQHEKNKILIIAGILQEPFFKFDGPDYLNYGGIGYVMGHEIIHGFDSTGRKYDNDGNYKNWWNNNTANEFENRVKCLVDQYDNYIVKQINQKIDGNRTKGENITDAGGIKLAYHAYQNFVNSKGITEQCLPDLDYSAQKMFWINAGSIWCSKVTDQLMRFILTDAHSPAEARANVAFSNIREFADDFNCPVGSKMNPAKKCIVW